MTVNQNMLAVEINTAISEGKKVYLDFYDERNQAHRARVIRLDFPVKRATVMSMAVCSYRQEEIKIVCTNECIHDLYQQVRP